MATQQKGSTVTVLIGIETTYGTASDTGFAIPVNSISMSPNQNKTSPATLTGTRNPVVPIAGNYDVSGNIVIPVDSIAMWYWMQLLFGDPTTTGTGPYVHEYKVGNTMPSFTLEEACTDLDTDKYLRYVGCKITSFSIDAGGDGELVANFGIMGAGYSIEASAFDSSPTSVSLARLDNFEAALTEGGSSIANVTALTISADMGLDGDTFVIGGGGTRGGINEGIVSVTGNMTMLFDDDAVAVMAKAVASTESALKLTITNAATSIFELEIQELEFGLSAPGLDGPQGRKVTVPYSAFYTNGSEASVIVARVTNSVAHA